MKETLRILFSIAFLTTVFLCAYNYVNSSADDRQNSLSSFFGGRSDKPNEDEAAPSDDNFQLGPSDPFTTPPVQNNPNFQPATFDNAATANTTLPIMPPESQPATPSAPYGLAAPPVTDNSIASSNDPSIVEPLIPDAPPASSVAPIDPLPPVTPIDPEVGKNELFTASQTIPNNANPTQENSCRPEVTAFLEEANRKIANGEILTALSRLSQYYNSPDFTPYETRQIHLLLIQLAGEVLYLHPEKYFDLHTVQPGDTITSIAERYQIPWQLIAKINGIKAPYHVNPGEQIKVLPGPFNAEVHLDKYELTLWLPIKNDINQSLYAGTFPIGLGGDCPRLQGDYIIDGKYINPEYPKLSNNPTTFGPGDSNNPYGKRLLVLACVNDPNHVKIGIHGTNNEQYIRQSVPYGFICLGARDIDDLYDILSVGSRVKIER